MSQERAHERAEHEKLRDAIRATALSCWDRRAAETEDMDAVELLRETRAEVQTGVLVDYVVVGVFDSGQDHNVTAVLRTDGSCSHYRTVGLLAHALADTL